jgi:hypothetical protein
MKRGRWARWVVYGMMLGTALFFVFVGAGCRRLDDYTRSYTVTYEDREGQRVSVGVTLERREAREMMEQVAAAKLPPSPLGQVVSMVEDAEPVPMREGAVQLKRLTEEAPERAGVAVTMDETTPGETGVFLTRDGKLRLETDLQEAAVKRQAGWVDAPVPKYNPETELPPVWRGRWVVKRAR